MTSIAARHTALCLLKNPRPPRPSFNCPYGCPHHLQETCPAVNCIWGDPRGAYVRPTVDSRGYEVSPFRSIPFGFWWFFTSSTTVGYGDFYPTTDAGKFTAVLCFYMGIILLALPITVIGGNFTTMYRQWVEEMAMTKEVAEAARAKRGAAAATVAVAAAAPTAAVATA